MVKKFPATQNASGKQLIVDMSRYLVQVKPDRANVQNYIQLYLYHSTIVLHNSSTKKVGDVFENHSCDTFFSPTVSGS